MNMIEKVARALYPAFETPCMCNRCEKAKDDAKAAILAMREPSDGMLKAFYGDTPVERWLGDDWRDMIDAALKEE